MNIVVKIKVVEETQLYRNFWISASRDRPGGELWKVDGRQMKIFNFLPFDDFRWFSWSKNFKFNDEVYLGIRPEDISLRSNNEIQVDVKVDLVENLGFEKIIYSKNLENQIIIKSSENIDNHSLKISFSKDKVLFFDKNENRIR